MKNYNVKYCMLKIVGGDLFGIFSETPEPTRDKSDIDTNSITEAERELDRRFDEYKKEINKWEENLKSLKVHSSCKEELLDEARMAWGVDKKYHHHFTKAIELGIEIPANMVEVRTDIKYCEGSNHVGEPCKFGKKGNTCDEDCDVKQFIYKKMDALDEIKSEIYYGSRQEDDSIDWVLKRLNEKGYEVVKKK